MSLLKIPLISSIKSDSYTIPFSHHHRLLTQTFSNSFRFWILHKRTNVHDQLQYGFKTDNKLKLKKRLNLPNRFAYTRSVN